MSTTLALRAEAFRCACRQGLVRLRDPRVQTGLIGGSVIMLVGQGLITGINFGYNVVIAHLLGPAEFGHASVAVTLLMLASAITLAFQLVAAKLVARNELMATKVGIIRRLRGQSWMLSSAIAVVLVLFSGQIADYLRLPTRVVIWLLAAAILFYVPLGVRRGAMQGMCDFSRLTGNLLLENSVKFIAAVLLIWLFLTPDTDMLGAVAALTVSVAAAYFLPRMTPALRAAAAQAQASPPVSPALREGIQATVFFVGQVIINNIDIVMVKHFFSPYQAGLYAAVALVGRVLYFGAWSVVSAMYPISAAAAANNKESRSFLALPMLLVAGMTLAFIALTSMFGPTIMQTVFGASFLGPAEKLLGWYAGATGLYALSVVLIAYEMSRKIANTAWLQMAFAALEVIGISFFHSTLQQVIVVQIVLMFGLLLMVSIPFLTPRRRSGQLAQEAA